MDRNPDNTSQEYDSKTSQIVDIKTLRSILSDENGMLERHWRDLPHFSIGQGKDLRGARFDVNDVLFFLKAVGGNYDLVEGANGELALEIRAPQGTKTIEACRQSAKAQRGRFRVKVPKLSKDEVPEEILALFKRSGGKVSE